MINNFRHPEIGLVLLWLGFIVGAGVLIAFAITVSGVISSWMHHEATRAQRHRGA
ncbi:MAG: hypothetical protein ACKVUT_11910 [Gaiella sp.]